MESQRTLVEYVMACAGCTVLSYCLPRWFHWGSTDFSCSCDGSYVVFRGVYFYHSLRLDDEQNGSRDGYLRRKLETYSDIQVLHNTFSHFVPIVDSHVTVFTPECGVWESLASHGQCSEVHFRHTRAFVQHFPTAVSQFMVLDIVLRRSNCLSVPVGCLSRLGYSSDQVSGLHAYLAGLGNMLMALSAQTAEVAGTFVLLHCSYNLQPATAVCLGADSSSTAD